MLMADFDLPAFGAKVAMRTRSTMINLERYELPDAVK